MQETVDCPCIMQETAYCLCIVQEAQAEGLTDTVAADVACRMGDGLQVFPALPPAIVDALRPERQQQEQCITWQRKGVSGSEAASH